MEIEVIQNNDVELELQDFVQMTPGFKYDDKNESQIVDDVFDLKGKDNNYQYYKQHFVDKDIRYHWTWICKDACISIVKEDDKYISIIRNKERDERREIEINRVKVTFFRKIFKMGPNPKTILEKLLNTTKLPNKIRLIQTNQFVRELEKFEKKNTIQGFKFGILYAQEGQTKEEEMLSNTKTSKDYDEFLEFLGTKITLKGWNSFRAGLDVKNGSTGDNSLFTEYKHNPIMFHVSTLLPFSKEKQQLERKRHICNDLVLLVFQEGDQPFISSSISSRMVHVIFLIKQLTPDQHKFDPKDTYYSLTVIRKEGVPAFAPVVKSPSIFKKGEEFRDLLFKKLLNAERAIYSVEAISKKMLSTRSLLLENLDSTNK